MPRQRSGQVDVGRCRYVDFIELYSQMPIDIPIDTRRWRGICTERQRERQLS